MEVFVACSEVRSWNQGPWCPVMYMLVYDVSMGGPGSSQAATSAPMTTAAPATIICTTPERCSAAAPFSPFAPFAPAVGAGPESEELALEEGACAETRA